MSLRPGQALARRPLHFFWLADCSGSMQVNGKIQALNNAVRETLPHLIDVAGQNPYADLLVRCLAFSTGTRWHIERPTPVDQVVWQDLQAGGYTDMGKALRELAKEMRVPPMEERALPPAIVILSDGQPTDEFTAGLEEFLATPWGKRAVRLAIAIGRDADYNILQRFIGNPEIAPVPANNPEQLAYFLRWASTVAAKVASAPEVGQQPHISVPDFPGPASGAADLTW